MPKTNLQLAKETRVRDSLKEDAKTIQAIADETGFGYYTIRRVVQEMLEREELVVTGVVDRSTLYSLNKNFENSAIPYLTDIVSRRSYKAIDLLSLVGRERSINSSLAAGNIVKHVTRLMDTANYASHGMDVKEKLDRIRDDMQRDFIYLKNVSGFYEQILNEASFWSQKHLADMVKDDDFIYADVARAVDYFEKEAENEDED